MDVVVQKDAIERDLTVLRGKHEQSQKELSQHKLRLSVVERDFRQAKVCSTTWMFGMLNMYSYLSMYTCMFTLTCVFERMFTCVCIHKCVA